MTTRGKAATVLAAVLLLGGLAGCAGSSVATPNPDPAQELTIFAAASLTEPFDALAAGFAAEHPEVRVRPIVYDGSSTLATQLKGGASADVFASADAVTMAEVADAGLIDGSASVFASNTLQVAVQPGNPLGVRSLADLARQDLLVVLCSPRVPCGAATHRLLALGGVDVTPVSEEQNVSAVVTKVRLGEADAGLVYTTDVLAAAGAVDGVALRFADRVINRYAIGIPTTATSPDAAKAFVRWVLSADGQAVLAEFGFGQP